MNRVLTAPGMVAILKNVQTDRVQLYVQLLEGGFLTTGTPSARHESSLRRVSP
jgi:hypothetical protein